MALQIRRGTESDRTSSGSFNSLLPSQGELVYTTDQKELWVGDGSTYGGIRVAPVRSVNGLTGVVALTSDNITQGSTNKYYVTSQAQQDAATALINGNGSNTGITFAYNSGTITATVATTPISAATATTLGGVKVGSTGGLTIDGSGLVTVTTPVSAGVASHLTYYTGTNAVGDTGTGLTWATTNSGTGGYPGGLLTVVGTANVQRIQIDPTTSDGGILIQTQNDGNSQFEIFSVQSFHSSSTPTAARLFHGRGTGASPATVVTGDALFDLQFVGQTGSASASISSQIRAYATGTITSSAVPGRLVFSSADASGTLQPTLTMDSASLTIAGNLKYTGYKLLSPNYITVSTTTTYALSTTTHVNVLLVTTGSLTATLTMPPSPVDGQVCMISVQTTNVTLALTAGPTLSGSFVGAVTAPTTFEYVYRTSNTTWYRIQ